MITETKLGPRLFACASLVRKNAVLLDVGTDHAYIPIFLAERGLVSSAVASDLRVGPLSVAREHIAEAGLSGKVRTVLTDGLSGLEEKGATDIVIAGMGGLLIRDILAAAPFVKDPSVALILQPMKNENALRAWLLQNGFSLVLEKLALEEGKIYTVLYAVYDGQKRDWDALSLLVGRDPVCRTEQKDLFLLLLEKNLATYKKKVEGMTASSPGYGEAKEIFDGLLSLLSSVCETV